MFLVVFDFVRLVRYSPESKPVLVIASAVGKRSNAANFSSELMFLRSLISFDLSEPR